MARRPKGLSPVEIRYRLALLGLTSADVDRRYSLRPGIARATMRHPHPAGEAAIAETLSLPASSIWPERYDTQGRRLKPQPAHHYTRRPVWRASQKTEAT